MSTLSSAFGDSSTSLDSLSSNQHGCRTIHSHTQRPLDHVITSEYDTSTDEESESGSLLQYTSAVEPQQPRQLNSSSLELGLHTISCRRAGIPSREQVCYAATKSNPSCAMYDVKDYHRQGTAMVREYPALSFQFHSRAHQSNHLQTLNSPYFGMQRYSRYNHDYSPSRLPQRLQVGNWQGPSTPNSVSR
jgi:hypothetical protein